MTSGAIDIADTSALRVFVAIVETGSFSEGAKKVDLTRSAAGKALARLEDLLGVRLLHRTTRRVGLTTDGQAFYERVVPVLEDLEDAHSLVMRSEKPRGCLRITATEAYGRQVVLPVLGEFLECWPELNAETSFTDRLVDLVEEGFDVAIRFGDAPESSDLISRGLSTSRAQLCASPAYLEQFSTPATFNELSQHRQLIYGTRRTPHAWRLADAQGREVVVPTRPFMYFDNASAVRDATVAGLGVTCLPGFLLAKEVDSGTLTVLLPEFSTPDTPISVVYPSRRHLAPKVRLFIDLLVKRLSS